MTHRLSAWAFLALVLIAVVGALSGYRLNLTASMPIGIWRVYPPPTTLERGSIVVVCLPRPLATMALERDYLGPGSCSTGAEPLLKIVGAVTGDLVSITTAGLAVNGEPIPNSASNASDPAGRPLPTLEHGDYQVQDGGFWAVALSPMSFDSRYFGQLPLSAIVGAASPVITWQRP